jgi:exodeoxyribonuclease VII small subunit
MDTPTTPPVATEDPGIPFEQAIGRVEELVARMEAERLPLDDLIQAYDEGTRLLDICRQRLDDAQRRVDLITQRADGTATLAPFATDDTPTAEAGTSRSKPRS